MLRGRRAIGLAGLASLATLWTVAVVTAAETCPFDENATAANAALAAVQGAQTVQVDTYTFMIGFGGRNVSGCQTYPAQETLFCSSVLAGANVYMPDAELGTDADLADVLAVEMELEARFGDLSEALASAGAECAAIFRVYACVSKYPVCDQEASPAPMKMSADACQEIRSSCAGLLASHPGLVTACDAESSSAAPQYFFRPNEWIGTDVWETNAATPSFSGQDLDVLAAAVDTTFTCEYPLEVAVDRVAPGSLTCEYPAKLPVYSDDAWESMRQAVVVPGLLSIPFNVFAFYKASQELRNRPPVYGIRRPRSDGDRRRIVLKLFRLAAGFGILFAFVSAVPAASIGFDVGLVSQAATKVHESAACWVTKTAPFVLMSLVNMITMTLAIIWLRVHAAKRMRRYRGSRREQVCVWTFSFLLPAILCACALGLDDPRQYDDEGRLVEFQTMYLVRNTFMCFPRLAHASHELILIHIPLLLSGIAGFVTAISVSLLLRSERNSCFSILCGNMSFASTSVIYSMQGSASSRSSSGSSSGGQNGIGRSLRKAGPSGGSRAWRTVNRATDEGISLRITAQTIRLGSLFFFFIFLAFIGVLSTAPSLETFATSMFRWWDCTSSEGFFGCVDTLEQSSTAYDAGICCSKCSLDGFGAAYPGVCDTCDGAPSSADLFLDPLDEVSGQDNVEFGVPPPGRLTLFYLAYSMIPLAFGVSFAVSHLKHVLSTRQNDYSPSRASQSTFRTTGASSGSKGGYMSPFRRTDTRRNTSVLLPGPSGVFDAHEDDIEPGFYSVTSVQRTHTPAPPTDAAPEPPRI